MLLFDSSRHGGSGYDLARILRATHQRPFVGQSLSAAAFVKPKGGEWTFVDRTKPLLYGTVLVLLGLTFLLNLVAIGLRRRSRAGPRAHA